MFMNEYTILDLLQNHMNKGSLRNEGHAQTIFKKKKTLERFLFCLLISTYKNKSERYKMQRFMNGTSSLQEGRAVC
jgi:hypothetical protein